MRLWPWENPIVKRCACGRNYTLTAWRRLELAYTEPGEPGEHVEFRHCRCRSTLGVGFCADKRNTLFRSKAC